jgi:quinolinate synthase
MSSFYHDSPGTFPSLLIRADRLEPRGAFAEAQAKYLNPDAAVVEELDALLREKNVGVVAHFYMDPELQGVLSACRCPHVHIADSLEMAGRAVEMVQAGATVMAVLGVDFMSENARAMIDAAGFARVPVYRVSDKPVGCTLAEAAHSPAYGAYLREASRTPRSLHVIYVNTGLDVKARAQTLVPTITCTSSNVVQLVLQAAAQVPGIRIWFGPDTYMGENLQHLFSSLLDLDESAVRALHPGHTHRSIEELSRNFRYFRQGACIVHQIFGEKVVELIERDYGDAYVAAHMEVPGGMFSLGLAGHHRGTGVVGSTANILQFIEKKVTSEAGGDRVPRFIIGTEAGMVTPIVRRIQAILGKTRGETGQDAAAEIIFPVAGDAISETDDRELGIVPGVAGGEGCSVEGGCAICPYMKMNSLDALFALLKKIDAVGAGMLRGYEPTKYGKVIGGRTVADLGGETIINMREYQKNKRLPDALVRDVLTRHEPPPDDAA